MRKIIHTILVMFFFSCLQAQEKEPLRILVFSKTGGFRHESISSGVKMIYDKSKENSWLVTCTEDPAFFTETFLSAFDVFVFMNPTGDVFDAEQQRAFEKTMERGKGFVGIHASADFEYEWAWYGDLNGAFFLTHPPGQEATVIIENTNHPAMKPFEGLKTYTTFDEWYTFRENPRGKVNVLATLDESTIKKFSNDKWKMGDHPLIWWQEKGSIRSFYTVFGHTHEAFRDSKVIEHITAAINWAGKR